MAEIMAYSKVCVVTQSCPTLCDLMDCSRPGSSVHGIFQARVPEWVAIRWTKIVFQRQDFFQIDSYERGLFSRLILVREELTIADHCRRPSNKD